MGLPALPQPSTTPRPEGGAERLSPALGRSRAVEMLLTKTSSLGTQGAGRAPWGGAPKLMLTARVSGTQPQLAA